MVAIFPQASHTYSDGESASIKLSDDLATLLAGRDIDYIDLLPNFQDWVKLNPDKNAHFLLDGHPNADGQSIIADGVSNYLIGILSNKIKNGNF